MQSSIMKALKPPNPYIEGKTCKFSTYLKEYYVMHNIHSYSSHAHEMHIESMHKIFTEIGFSNLGKAFAKNFFILVNTIPFLLHDK